jgi:nucleoside-diphosphate-sugar epimerase
MASLLIIGGSGFFGKSILDAYGRGLLQPWAIDQIIIVSRHATNLLRTNAELIASGVKLINLDISNTNDLPVTDYVIHAAASTDASIYLKNPLEEKKNIQTAVLNYCSLARKFHHNSKIVYCSSGAVYGQQPPFVDELREDSALGSIEEMALGKRDYASAKRDAEIAIQKLAIEGMNVSIARCFAFVGVHLPRNQHFAIGNFIEDGLNSRPIQVQASYSVIRSYMYVDDLVIWLMTLATYSSPQCPIINIGSNEAIEISRLASKIANFFSVPVEFQENSSSQTDRYVPSIAKAEKEMKLHLCFNLDLSINATIKRIQQN